MPFVAVKSSILIRESVGTDSFSPPALSGTAAPHRLNFLALQVIASLRHYDYLVF